MPRAPKDPNAPPKPAAKRKARPKFEVEPEQVSAPAAGWVYRDTMPEPEPEPVVTAPPPPIPPPPPPPPANSIPMLAFGAFAVAVGFAVHMSLFAVKTMNAPMRMANGLLGRLRR